MLRKFKCFLLKKKFGGRNITALGKIIVRGNGKVIIGDNVILYPNIIFWVDNKESKIVIGDNCKIGDNVIIKASFGGGVYIGKSTLIAANCYIIDSNHTTRLNGNFSCNDVKSIHIGDNCWLGNNVTVLKGTLLNDGCIVGAMALTNKEFPSNTIIGGIPGRVIRVRS